jgi:hypothetical protein
MTSYGQLHLNISSLMSTEQSTEGTESRDGETTNQTDGVTGQGQSSESNDVSTETQPESKPKPLTKEEKQAQIVESFKDRLAEGVLTMEEIEAKQPWVAEILKTKQEEPNQPAVTKQDAREIAREMLNEERAEQELESLKSTLKGEEYDSFKKEYDSILQKLGHEEAMEFAAYRSGVDISPEARRRASLRMVPEAGESPGKVPTEDQFILDHKGKSIEEKREFLRKERDKRGNRSRARRR